MIPIENSVAGRVADIHHLMPHAEPAHRRRALPAGPSQLMAPKGATLEDDQDGREPRPRARPVPQASSASSAIKAGGRRRHRGRGARRSPRRGDMTRAALAPTLAGEDLRPRRARRERRGRGAQHHALRHPVARAEMAPSRQRPGGDDLRVPGAQRAGRALQGAGRLRHQRRQHDQARKLHGRGQFLRHACSMPTSKAIPTTAALALALEELEFFSQRAEDPRRLSGASVPRDRSRQEADAATRPRARSRHGEAAERKVRRTLHLRFTLPSARPDAARSRW